MISPSNLLKLAIRPGAGAEIAFHAVLTANDQPLAPEMAIARDRYRPLHDLSDGYRQLLKSGGNPSLAPTALESLGLELFDLWLAPFWPELEKRLPERGSTPLCIVSPAAEIHNLPWELARPPGGPPLALEPRLLLRRSLPREETEPPSANHVPFRRPIRLLFMACAPSNSGNFNYVNETEALMGALAGTENNIILKTPDSGTFETFQHSIRTFRPHIVHLSGPALIRGERGFFGFEDDSGDADIRTASEVTRALPGEGVIPLFIISGHDPERPPPTAAIGAMARGVINDRIPLALSWPATLTAAPAADLAQTFYHALAETGLPDQALQTARRARLAADERSGHPGWTLPQIYAAPRQAFAFDGRADIEGEPAPEPPATLLPPPGMIAGFADPHCPRRRDNQRLLPALRAGHLQMLLLTGAKGSGKTTLATDLARNLEPHGFHTIAVATTPFAPLSTARILATFEAAFRRLGFNNELEIITNPRIGNEDRLGFLVAVLNRRFAFTVILDGLESALDTNGHRFLEPGFAAFFAYMKEQVNGLSRVIVTSRIEPVVGAPAPSPATFRQEPIAPLREPGCPAHDSREDPRLAGLDDGQRRHLLPLTLLTTPLPAPALAACLTAPPAEIGPFLKDQQRAGRLFAVRIDREERFAPHPSLLDSLRRSDWNESSLAALAASSAALADHLIAQLTKPSTNTAAIPGWLDAVLACTALNVQANRFESALELSDAVNEYLSKRGFFWELERFNRSLLAVREHPRLLQWLATALTQQDRRPEAKALFERIVTVFTERFPREAAMARFELAGLETMDDRLEQALEHLQRALAINIELKDVAGEAVCQTQIGFLQVRRSREEEALAHLESALTLYRRMNHPPGLLQLLPWTGDLYFRQGDHDRARDHFQEVLPLLKQSRDEMMACQVYHQLATIDLNQGRHEKALAGFRISLNIKRRIDDKKGEASTFFQLGRLAKEKNDQMGCLQLLGLCQRIDAEIGDEDATQELTLFNDIVQATGLEKERAEQILAEVWQAYERDRGESLLASIFPDGGAANAP